MKKAALRHHYKDILANLTPKRAVRTLPIKGNILSFASKGEEIELTPLNEILAKEGRLFLPRVEGKTLVPFKVTDLSYLVESKWYIDEPDPAICKLVSIDEIDAILVPGLAFDKRGNRLGYGMGFYDRFLQDVTCQTIGIAYREQIAESLPIEPHDIPVDEVITA